MQSLDDLQRNFSDCVQQVKKVIPKGNWDNTKIFLGATGGMRLLQ